MVKVVVDTSVLIEYFRTKKGDWERLVDLREERKVELILSAVVVMELWAGKSVAERRVRQDLELLLKGVRVVSMGEEIAKKAGELKRERRIGAMDAVVAATALKEGSQLATLNKKDFKVVPGLQLWEG